MADLAIIVPTYRRADLLKPLLENIHEATSEDHHVYFVIESSDKETLTAFKALGAGNHQAVIGVHGSCARAWNAGYWASSEPFVFVTNDDVCFHDWWDERALKVMGANVHVVGVNDGHDRMRSFMLCRRSYIEKNSGVFDAPNTLVHPYQHNYVDTELAEYAKHRGVWGEAPDAVVEHLHWEYGQADAGHPNYQRSRETVAADDQLFQDKAGSMGGLIHVGAWEGLEFINDTRRLLLFEPQARAFETLKRNTVANPDTILVNAAAGAEPGELTMHKVNPDHSSSLFRPQWLRNGFDFDGEETVGVTTVDLTVKEFGLSGVFDELAIDTQGFELEVLKGATETLKDVVRVECELHDANTYPGAASLDDLDAFLADQGFVRTGLDQENSDDWGDAIYERADG